MALVLFMKRRDHHHTTAMRALELRITCFPAAAPARSKMRIKVFSIAEHRVTASRLELRLQHMERIAGSMAPTNHPRQKEPDHFLACSLAERAVVGRIWTLLSPFRRCLTVRW
jgi:hypothetical protein